MRVQATCVESRPQHLLTQLHAQLAESVDALGDNQTLFKQLFMGHSARNNANTLGFLGLYISSTQHDLEGAAGANCTGK